MAYEKYQQAHMKTRKVDPCESAECEAQAQLEIIRALRKLPT